MTEEFECVICKEPESAVDLTECDGCHHFVCDECSRDAFDQDLGVYITNCERCSMEERHV